MAGNGWIHPNDQLPGWRTDTLIEMDLEIIKLASIRVSFLNAFYPSHY